MTASAWRDTATACAAQIPPDDTGRPDRGRKCGGVRLSEDVTPKKNLRFKSKRSGPVLLVVTYSVAARQSLRNICRAHGDCVVRRLGRAALFEETQFAAFQTLRLREKHADETQVERTRPFNEFAALPQAVREAARAYEARDTPATPYAQFAANTDHPDPTTLKSTQL